MLPFTSALAEADQVSDSLKFVNSQLQLNFAVDEELAHWERLSFSFDMDDANNNDRGSHNRSGNNARRARSASVTTSDAHAGGSRSRSVSNTVSEYCCVRFYHRSIRVYSDRCTGRGSFGSVCCRHAAEWPEHTIICSLNACLFVVSGKLSSVRTPGTPAKPIQYASARLAMVFRSSCTSVI